MIMYDETNLVPVFGTQVRNYFGIVTELLTAEAFANIDDSQLLPEYATAKQITNNFEKPALAMYRQSKGTKEAFIFNGTNSILLKFPSTTAKTHNWMKRFTSEEAFESAKFANSFRTAYTLYQHIFNNQPAYIIRLVVDGDDNAEVYLKEAMQTPKGPKIYAAMQPADLCILNDLRIAKEVANTVVVSNNCLLKDDSRADKSVGTKASVSKRLDNIPETLYIGLQAVVQTSLDPCQPAEYIEHPGYKHESKEYTASQWISLKRKYSPKLRKKLTYAKLF